MKKEDYVSILQQNVTPSVEKFQQDNDSKHSFKIVKEWLLYRMPKVHGHPPQSSDLNPIEQLWEYVNKKVREFNISCKDDIKAVLQGEWTKIEPEFTKKLVESMPRRLGAVKKFKG